MDGWMKVSRSCFLLLASHLALIRWDEMSIIYLDISYLIFHSSGCDSRFGFRGLGFGVEFGSRYNSDSDFWMGLGQILYIVCMYRGGARRRKKEEGGGKFIPISRCVYVYVCIFWTFSLFLFFLSFLLSLFGPIRWKRSISSIESRESRIEMGDTGRGQLVGSVENKLFLLFYFLHYIFLRRSSFLSSFLFASFLFASFLNLFMCLYWLGQSIAGCVLRSALFSHLSLTWGSGFRC